MNRIESLSIGDRTNFGIAYDKPTWFPKSIDVNPTAKCNLHCSFCWGPDHRIPDGLKQEDWFRIIEFFASRGTTAVVFTGGEPLLRKDIGQLLQFAKNLNLHVTLSTNTLLLAYKCDETLPYVDAVGVPLDGSTPEKNNRMRLGTSRHFRSVLNALSLISNNYPNIEVTARTVVSQVNKDDLIQIGEVLYGQSKYFHRWKIYQFTAVSIGAASQREHAVTDEEFEHVIRQVTCAFPFLNIVAYPSKSRINRYIFVGPEGNLFGVDAQGGYRVIGNFFILSEEEIVQGVRSLTRPEINFLHACR